MPRYASYRWDAGFVWNENSSDCPRRPTHLRIVPMRPSFTPEYFAGVTSHMTRTYNTNRFTKQYKQIDKVFCQIFVTRFSLTAACHLIILEAKHSLCMSDGKKLLNFERYGRVIDYSTTHSTTIPSSCSILRGTRSWRPLYSVWEGNYNTHFLLHCIYIVIHTHLAIVVGYRHDTNWIMSTLMKAHS